MYKWPFLHEAGHAWPRLSLIVMDPSQELACSLTQKNEEAPGRCCTQEQPWKMAGDHRVVRLICSSGGDTEDSGDHCPDQTVSQTAGGPLLDSGQSIKIPLFILLSELFIRCSL